MNPAPVSPAAPALQIRPETPAERAEILDLTRRAFAGKPYADGNEPELIDALRDAGALALSLVAKLEGRLVGHLALSPASGEPGWFALGPISVDPALQRQGIGGALIRQAQDWIGRQGARGCMLVGSTAYYPRFGFVPRPALAPKGQPPEHFMIWTAEARAGDLPPNLRFHPVFEPSGPSP